MLARRQATQAAPELPAAAHEVPDVSTTERLLAALGQVDMERHAAQQILDGVEAAEAALLDDDSATDQQFAALQMRVRNAKRALVRLDRRDAQLLARADVHEQERAAAWWSSLRERYVTAAAQLAETCDQLRRGFAEVHDLAEEAARNGQRHRVPPIQAFVPWALFLAPRQIAEALPDRVDFPTVRCSLGPLMYVHFVKQFGSIAPSTFPSAQPAERARWLIQQRYAQLATDGPGSWIATWGSGPAVDELNKAEKA